MEEIKFDTINAIHERKEKLLQEIRNNTNRIDENWKSMFYNEMPKSKSNRWINIINTSTGILDGALLGWKLYRKFSKSSKKF
jgi:hypothetical protein